MFGNCWLAGEIRRQLGWTSSGSSACRTAARPQVWRRCWSTSKICSCGYEESGLICFTPTSRCCLRSNEHAFRRRHGREPQGQARLQPRRRPDCLQVVVALASVPRQNREDLRKGEAVASNSAASCARPKWDGSAVRPRSWPLFPHRLPAAVMGRPAAVGQPGSSALTEALQPLPDEFIALVQSVPLVPGHLPSVRDLRRLLPLSPMSPVGITCRFS